jgi:hypothetical protein
MSFQGYIDSIEAKTGTPVSDICARARAQGFATEAGLMPGVKAGTVLDWLAKDYGLGRGHGMAIVALLKGEKRI